MEQSKYWAVLPNSCTVVCPSLFSVTMIQHGRYQLGEGNGSFQFTRLQVHHWRKQGRNSSRNLEAGTEAKSHGGTLLAGMLFMTSAAASFTDPKPRNGPVHSWLGPPMLVKSQNKASQTCPEANMMEAILSLKVPSCICEQLELTITQP